MKRTHNQNQQGAVAIFVVIFAALFITIITVSFVGIMLKNQTQSVNADLADSAYDSALAGVEDAKRLFQKYKECEASGNFGVGNAACDRAQSSIDAGCYSTKKFITGLENGEMTIQRSSGSSDDVSLHQAYTCVKLNLNSDYRDGIVDRNEFGVVPLSLRSPVGSTATTFNKIQVSWFAKEDDNNGSNAGFYNTPPRLPAYSAWRTSSGADTVPSLLRVQFVGVDGGFNLADFDTGAPDRRTGTVFLYPRQTAPSGTTILPESAAKPALIKCADANNELTVVGSKNYLCTAELSLTPQPISAQSYLIVAPIYRSTTHYSVQVFSDTTPLIFTNVANVDSTGRANDIFRRVRAQIELDTSGGSDNTVYPSAALEVGQLCKNFSVTDRGQDFYHPGTCTP